MIMQYRKKPIVITAEQFLPNLKAPQCLFWGFPVMEDADGLFVSVPTLEGAMRCNERDWLIRGIKDEVYPCKPDIFEATYESANP